MAKSVFPLKIKAENSFPISNWLYTVDSPPIKQTVRKEYVSEQGGQPSFSIYPLWFPRPKYLLADI